MFMSLTVTDICSCGTNVYSSKHSPFEGGSEARHLRGRVILKLSEVLDTGDSRVYHVVYIATSRVIMSRI